MKRSFNTKWLTLIGIILITVAIILIVAFFMRGSVTVSGKYPDKETNESLLCINERVTYPVLNDDGKDATVDIILIFTDNQINSISLIFKKAYDSNTLAKQALARMMASMNKSFGVEFGAGAFNANYSANGTNAQMSLYADVNDMKLSSNKYFMIDEPLRTIEQYQENYNLQGFKCEINN